MSAARVGLTVLVIAAIGFFIPYTADPGISKFRNDPTQYQIAQRIVHDYWVLNHNPLTRLLIPGYKVVRIWLKPGNCRGRPTNSVADYRAQVRRLTWFGIRDGTIDVTCGGDSWSWQ